MLAARTLAAQAGFTASERTYWARFTEPEAASYCCSDQAPWRLVDPFHVEHPAPGGLSMRLSAQVVQETVSEGGAERAKR